MRRLATQNDFEHVYAIYMHERVVPYLAFDPMPAESFRAPFGALVESGSFFVYEVEGRIVGFYKSTRYEGRAGHVAYLSTLAIAPSVQGRGLAQRMVNEAIEMLRLDGVVRVELLVESDNLHAIRFYTRLGFVHEGTMRKAYKRASDQHYVDELVMALLLPEVAS